MPGSPAVGSEVARLLSAGPSLCQNVKFLMAFANERGLGMIRLELEHFHDGGGVVEFIVGLDYGITSRTALEYLTRRLPNASVYAFHTAGRQATFHPKMILFEGTRSVSVIVGSSNLTSGGMATNFELGALVELDPRRDFGVIAAIQDVWGAYRNPRPPLKPAHLQLVTDEWLAMNRGHFMRRRTSPPVAAPSGFPPLQVRFISPPPVSTPGGRHASTAGRPRPRVLWLQVLEETGQGGTQLQLPVKAVSEYFGVSTHASSVMRVSVDNSPFRDVRLSHFPNHTHRVSIAELGGVRRPALLRFRRVGRFHRSFACSIITGRSYLRNITRCKEQTRPGARCWAVEL